MKRPRFPLLASVLIIAGLIPLTFSLTSPPVGALITRGSLGKQDGPDPWPALRPCAPIGPAVPRITFEIDEGPNRRIVVLRDAPNGPIVELSIATQFPMDARPAMGLIEGHLAVAWSDGPDRVRWSILIDESAGRWGAPAFESSSFPPALGSVREWIGSLTGR